MAVYFLFRLLLYKIKLKKIEWTFWISGNDYRVNTLSKMHLTVTKYVKFEIKEQFGHV